MKATVLRLAWIPLQVEPTHIWAIDTQSLTMAETICRGHINPDGTPGILGRENPKASLEVPGQPNLLLCKACWQAQGLILEVS